MYQGAEHRNGPVITSITSEAFSVELQRRPQAEFTDWNALCLYIRSTTATINTQDHGYVDNVTTSCVGALQVILAVPAENPADLSEVLKLSPKLEDRLSEVQKVLVYAVKMGEARFDRALRTTPQEPPCPLLRSRKRRTTGWHRDILLLPLQRSKAEPTAMSRLWARRCTI
ncbi:hypothetical protein ColTof4_14406 [Colletotrichum tofieldiae]|nr:hypothetical protein ColTof3_14874 [Colletotrichum tofieldiae]GKT81983.1 hypothetical protein ColTof4_14406 [Colletotrichum tofieldiae]